MFIYVFVVTALKKIKLLDFAKIVTLWLLKDKFWNCGKLSLILAEQKNVTLAL